MRGLIEKQESLAGHNPHPPPLPYHGRGDPAERHRSIER
jgi:hypothetical protein